MCIVFLICEIFFTRLSANKSSRVLQSAFSGWLSQSSHCEEKKRFVSVRTLLVCQEIGRLCAPTFGLLGAQSQAIAGEFGQFIWVESTRTK
jgi:hypothetical protein